MIRLFLLFILIQNLITCEAHHDLTTIIVPKHYDISLPPEANGTTPVDIHMTIHGVSNINEKDCTFDVDLFLALSWQDRRLNLSSPSQGTFYTLPAHPLLDYIWHPRVFFKGAKSVTIAEHPHQSEYLWIYEENYIVHMLKLQIKQRYPFSTKTDNSTIYKIILESLSDDTTKMEMRWNIERPVVLDQDFILPEAMVQDAVHREYRNSYGGKNFSIAELSFKIRKPKHKKRKQQNILREE